MRTVLYVQATSEIGGSDIALWQLVSHLDRAAFRAVAVLPASGPLVPKLADAGCAIRIEPMMQLRPIRSAAYQAAYLGRFWPTVVRLARVIRQERAVLVHTNSLFSLYGSWAAWLRAVPHVWHIREIPQLPSPIQRPLLGMVGAISSEVVTMTNAVADLFGPPARRPPNVQTIYEGIDLRIFHPRIRGERIRRALQLEADAPLVGFVARLDPWKGADVFIRAAAQVAKRRLDTHFLVCGGQLRGYEEYAGRMKRLAVDLGLRERMHFTDWTYRLDDIPEVMAAIDVLVHPPIRPEPFGLVLVEAMATGKPVVASRAGGIPEVVEGGVTGLLVPPGDPDAVAQATLELLNDRSRANAMGRAGRLRAERRFDVDAYAARVQQLYDTILVQREAVTA